jgi:hypothetical protein
MVQVPVRPGYGEIFDRHIANGPQGVGRPLRQTIEGLQAHIAAQTWIAIIIRVDLASRHHG